MTQRDFLTTYVEGNSVALRSFAGDFLSAPPGASRVTTSRFRGPSERFLVEMTQSRRSRACRR